MQSSGRDDNLLWNDILVWNYNFGLRFCEGAFLGSHVFLTILFSS
jgi:hypothetical protein